MIRTPGDEHHSLDDVAPRDREEAWGEILSTTLMPMSIRVPRDSAPRFRGRIRRQWLDDLALLDCRTDPFTGSRGRSRIDSAAGGFVAILMDVTGYEHVTQRGVTVRLEVGGGVVLNSGQPMAFDVPVPYRKRCLVVPVEALAETGAPQPTGACVELPRSQPAVALLGGYLDALSRTLPAMCGVARTAARNAALELVAGALRSDTTVDGAGVAPALRASMDRWIDRHLLDPSLSPAAIAAAHAVSVRTVYRLFGSGGATFGAVVRSRRLARARTELALGQRSLSAIANRWGFADASHFSRSFKDAFGMSPSAYRAQAAARTS